MEDDHLINAGDELQAPGQQVFKHFVAATVQHCRWLPCPSSEVSTDIGDMTAIPAALAVWSEDAQGHALTIGDVLEHPESGEMLGFTSKLGVPHRGSFTDLQTARIGDTVFILASSSTGTVTAVQAQLPGQAGATGADLQVIEPALEGGCANPLLQLPGGVASSVSINDSSQALLVVGTDGTIVVGSIDQPDAAVQTPFKAGKGYGGYTQGRWCDRSTFVTSGLVGGLQLWDVRQGPKPILKSPAKWGHTGHAALDAREGVARQLFCVDVHPARPNVCATGSTGGTVALWDLRFDSAPLTWGPVEGPAGDVWEVHFDPSESASSRQAVPPVLYCTSDGALAATGGNASVLADATNVNFWAHGAQQQQQRGVELLYAEGCSSVNSFDVKASLGQDILAGTDAECIVLLHVPPKL